MCKKDRVDDLFKDNILNNLHMYNDSNSHQRYIQYRFTAKSAKVILDKIYCIFSLKLAKGILFPLLLMKRIEVQKKLFIMNIDALEHVYLENDLS